MQLPTHETIQVRQQINRDPAIIWAEYEDVSRRAQWCVPAGEDMVYDESDFREGGRDRYRCGTPAILEFQVDVEYVKVVPLELMVYSETVRRNNQVLATALVTWAFDQHDAGTTVHVTSQITSFTGVGMIEGNLNGHSKALQQLNSLLNETV